MTYEAYLRAKAELEGRSMAMAIIREQGKDKRHPSRIEIPDSDIRGMREKKKSVEPDILDQWAKFKRVKSEHDGYVT